jgi:hypothetical protein
MLPRRWKCLFVAVLAMLLHGGAQSGSAQVTVVKNGIDVPEERVELIYGATCRVVAEEFHLANGAALQFPITLILGDANERVSGDELNQTYFIYMERWNEPLFAASTSRLALQHLLTRERKTKIVAEILRRANRNATVSYQELRRP